MMRYAIILSILIAIFAATPVSATSPRQAAREGSKLYQKAEYDKALAEFLTGLEAAPDRKELKFDLGSALYKLEDYPKAGEIFGAVADDPSKLSGDAWYNLGNALMKSGTPDKAIEAYKNTLRLNHADADAKHNLEMALRLMQQQQQQQQQQGEQDSTGNEQQEQEQQQQSEADSTGNEQQQQPEPDEDQEQEEEQPQPQPSDRESDMTPEEALQLLQAMENEEQEAQKEKLKRQFGEPRRVEKDW